MEQDPSSIDRIIDPIEATLFEIEQEHAPTADDIAWDARQGLKESVRLGYMHDHNARAIYAKNFPDYLYDE